MVMVVCVFFVFKQKTAYEVRISDWSSDVCSSDLISEGQKRSGVSIKHDISVPISKIDSFLARAGSALTKSYPGIRLVAFGHVGDGNIHFNPMQPQAADGSQWKENTEDVNRIVHDLVHELGGSISAEHGIGHLRFGEIERSEENRSEFKLLL